jgi:copper chaperone
MTTHQYSVPTMSCDHCRNSIESGVGAVAGVEQVKVDLEATTVSVTGGDDSAIRAAIDEAGYDIAD